MEEKFLNFAAGVMGVEPSRLGMDTVYKEFAPWDSLMMLTLIMETEEEYGVSIPIEKAGAIHTLADLYQIIGE